MKKLTVLFLTMVILLGSIFIAPVYAENNEPEWKALYKEHLTKYLYNRYKDGLDKDIKGYSDYTSLTDDPIATYNPFVFLYDFNADGTLELVCGYTFDNHEWEQDFDKEYSVIDKVYTIAKSKVVTMGSPKAVFDFDYINNFKRYFDIKTRKARYFTGYLSKNGNRCADELVFDFKKNKVKKKTYAKISGENGYETIGVINSKKITSESYYVQKIDTLFSERFIKYNDIKLTDMTKHIYKYDDKDGLQNEYDSISEKAFSEYADDIIALYNQKNNIDKITLKKKKITLNSVIDEDDFRFYSVTNEKEKSVIPDDKVIIVSGNQKVLKSKGSCSLVAKGVGKTKITVYSPNTDYKKTFEITVVPYAPNITLKKSSKDGLILNIGSVEKGVSYNVYLLNDNQKRVKLIAKTGEKRIVLKNLKKNKNYYIEAEVWCRNGDKKFKNKQSYCFKTKK